MLRNKRKNQRLLSRYPVIPLSRLTGKQATGNRLTIFMVLVFFLMSASLYAQEEFRYDAKGKHNPFIPWVTSDGKFQQLEKEETKGELSLDGIIYDKHGVSYALVNGDVVRTGDSVGDYQVLKIEEDRVMLIKDGNISEIKLEREE